ncbi:MAG: HIT family protein [Candidatus Nanoarchaeia archaeon]
MDNCLFCKIINGQIPCAKIWEDEEFIAFLDAFPNTKGMTLVLPKKHHDSEIFSIPDEELKNYIVATKKVVKILEKSLSVKRVAVVAEGMGVNHAHFKLYPLYGLEKRFEEMYASQKIFFEKYEGYVTTLIGPEANREDLHALAHDIRKKFGLE